MTRFVTLTQTGDAVRPVEVHVGNVLYLYPDGGGTEVVMNGASFGVLGTPADVAAKLAAPPAPDPRGWRASCTEPCGKVGRRGASSARCAFAQNRADKLCPCACHPDNVIPPAPGVRDVEAVAGAIPKMTVFHPTCHGTNCESNARWCDDCAPGLSFYHAPPAKCSTSNCDEAAYVCLTCAAGMIDPAPALTAEEIREVFGIAAKWHAALVAALQKQPFEFYLGDGDRVRTLSARLGGGA